MPTYEFKCHKCGARHTTILPVREIDDYQISCERCGTSMTKVIFPVGAIFKGSGFYRTDNRDA